MMMMMTSTSSWGQWSQVVAESPEKAAFKEYLLNNEFVKIGPILYRRYFSTKEGYLIIIDILLFKVNFTALLDVLKFENAEKSYIKDSLKKEWPFQLYDQWEEIAKLVNEECKKVISVISAS